MVAQKRILFSIFRATLFVGSLLLMTPDALLRIPAVGLDPSWEIGINLAVQNHLRFGQDFVFTFGPLGVLATRLPIGMGRLPLLLFDAAVMLLLGLAFFFVYRQTKTYFSATLAFLTIVLLDSVPQYTFGLTNILFLLFLFAVFYHLLRGDIASLVVAAFLSWLLFYMKANLGLATVPLMVGFLIYLLVRPKRLSRTFTAAFLAIYLVAGLALSVPLNVDLPGYVLGSLSLASSYNDAMISQLGPDNAGIQFAYLAVTVVVAFGLAFVADWRLYARDVDSILRFVLTGVFIFLVFKHSFVRASGHYGFFYFSVPPAIGLLTVFAIPGIRNRLEKVLILTLILSFPAAARLYTFDHLTTRLTRLRNYTVNALNPSPGPIANPDWEALRLPASTLDLIGDGSVDVIPWEIATVYVNGLTYNPRPVIQSYTAYDGYLDKLNEQKYLSPDAPDFILYTPGDIDSRHPLFVEPRTRRALLTHYEVVEETDNYLLFKRRETPLAVTEAVGEPQAGQLGELIPLEYAGGLQYLSADIEYSLLGKLARTFYQPPLLRVAVEFEDGDTRRYRAVKTLVNDEVLVNPFFDTVPGAGEFFRSNGEQGRRVRGITFYSAKPWAFQSGFTYQLREVTIESPGRARSAPSIRMADGLHLETVEATVAGDSLDVLLTWRDSPVFQASRGEQPYTASAQLLDQTGNRLAGFDVQLQEDGDDVSPASGAEPSVRTSSHRLELPTGLPPGRYDLLIGLYTLNGDQPATESSTVLEDFVALD